VIEKHRREEWEKLGSKSFLERAHERVEEILKTHRPEPLPREIEAKITEVRKKYGLSA
jgi:trimethylamine--corrinoid protein Co-methyltransferase